MPIKNLHLTLHDAYAFHHNGNMLNLIHNVWTAACPTKREKVCSFFVAPSNLIALFFNQIYKWGKNIKILDKAGKYVESREETPSDKVQSHPKIEVILLVGLTEGTVVKVTYTKSITVT